MLEKTEQTIKKYNLIENGDKIVIGVSGGPDSMTLLNLLQKLKEKYNLELYVAHINHMIRENAKIDEEYVKKYCENNNIKYFIKRANVIEEAQKEKKGLEEKGREIRYNFFEEVLKKTNSNKIAIAHNLNDRVETIIMNIIRGTGMSGLKGIEAKRGKYIRPLLETPRKEIEKYCNENQINPRYDETNKDITYTRNKIRNIVIPYLEKEFNPNITNGIIRLSDIIKEEQEYIDNEIKKAYKEIIIKEEQGIYYDLKKFNNKDKVIQKGLILIGIEKIFGNSKGIEKINIEDIIKLCNNNIGNKYLKPNKKTKIEIKNKQIIIKEEK